MTPNRERKADAAMYARVFEQHAEGALVRRHEAAAAFVLPDLAVNGDAATSPFEPGQRAQEPRQARGVAALHGVEGRIFGDGHQAASSGLSGMTPVTSWSHHSDG